MQIALAVLGALLLHAFYTAVRSGWPGSYSTLEKSLELFAVKSLLAYSAFRLVPFYLTSVAVCVLLAERSLDATPAILVLGILHFADTSGRAAWTTARNHSSKRRAVLVLLHLLTGAGIAGTGAFALMTFQYWGPVIPRPEALLNALWTGVIAAIVAVAATRWFPRRPSTSELIRLAKLDIGHDLWHYAQDRAAAHQTDGDMLRAIIAAEALQRPRWVRRIERIKGKVIREGTYGVAQVSAQAPIGDRESIDELANRFAGYYPPRDPDERRWLRHKRFEHRLMDHNASPVFRELAVDLYQELARYPQVSSPKTADDGRAVVEVLEISLKPSGWHVKGTVFFPAGTPAVTLSDEADALLQQFDLSTTGQVGSRRAWNFDAPIEAKAFLVSAIGGAGDPWEAAGTFDDHAT